VSNVAQEHLGFVGLGVMGAAMAGHLASKGHRLTVWNRTRRKAEPFRGRAEIAESLEEVSRKATVIFVCVSRTEDVVEVVHSMVATAQQGTLFVDHSTIAPRAAKDLAASLEERGLHLLDAPVTGGSIGAQKGTLTAFCGGREEDFERALPYLEAYTKTARLVGGSGAGQMMKMANQIAVCLTLLSMAECLVFAERAGLDLEACIELIGSGAGGSWSLQNYGPKAIAGDHTPGFSIANQQKDLVYALEAAREVKAALPGTALVHQLLAALENAGEGERATTALFELVRALSGQPTAMASISTSASLGRRET
jgi:3-hydroxyisobutyrate dehydrogenase